MGDISRFQQLAGLRVTHRSEPSLLEELQRENLLNENIFGDLLAGLAGAGKSMADDLSAATRQVADAVAARVKRYYESGKFAFNKSKAQKELKELKRIVAELKVAVDKARGIFDKIPNALFSKEVSAAVQMLASVQLQIDAMTKALDAARFDDIEDGATAPSESKDSAKDENQPAAADEPAAVIAFGPAARQALRTRLPKVRGAVRGWTLRSADFKQKADDLTALDGGKSLNLAGKFDFETAANAFVITGVIVDRAERALKFITSDGKLIIGKLDDVDPSYRSIATQFFE